MSVTEEQINVTISHLRNVLSLDSALRNQSAKFLLSFPVESPNEFLCSMISVVQTSADDNVFKHICYLFIHFVI